MCIRDRFKGGDAEATPAVVPAEASAGDDPMMMDEDALLQRAFALSMGGDENAAVVNTPPTEDEDPALLAALQMSMQEDPGGPGAADMLADPNYVNSILSSLPGVDPDDPSIQAALNADEMKEDEKEEDHDAM